MQLTASRNPKEPHVHLDMDREVHLSGDGEGERLHGLHPRRRLVRPGLSCLHACLESWASNTDDGVAV